MSTVIYDSPIFGPIHSRRLGISLGINLLPKGGKFCSFDCIYCECGLNSERRTKNPLPTADEVVETLESKLQELSAEGITPDVLTFAGNGEPTLHPAFPEIVERVKQVRDIYCPSAKMSILSNATQIRRPEIREALMHFDNNILKLDSAFDPTVALINRPKQASYRVERIVEPLELAPTTTGSRVMQSAYCLRREMGECLKEHPRLKGDLYLETGGHKYRLEFDCKRCEMNLIDCTK